MQAHALPESKGNKNICAHFLNSREKERIQTGLYLSQEVFRTTQQMKNCSFATTPRTFTESTVHSIEIIGSLF